MKQKQKKKGNVTSVRGWYVDVVSGLKLYSHLAETWLVWIEWNMFSLWKVVTSDSALRESWLKNDYFEPEWNNLAR